MGVKQSGVKSPPNRADILSDIAAALARDVKPPLPVYDPAVEMTISDMIAHLNRQRAAGTSPWLRINVEREMLRLKGDGEWTFREVMAGKRKANAWRPVDGR